MGNTKFCSSLQLTISREGLSQSGCPQITPGQSFHSLRNSSAYPGMSFLPKDLPILLLWVTQDPTEYVYCIFPALIHVPLYCDEEGLSPRRPAVEYLSAQEIKFSSEFSAYYKVMGCPRGGREILIWRWWALPQGLARVVTVSLLGIRPHQADFSGIIVTLLSHAVKLACCRIHNM